MPPSFLLFYVLRHVPSRTGGSPEFSKLLLSLRNGNDQFDEHYDTVKSQTCTGKFDKLQALRASNVRRGELWNRVLAICHFFTNVCTYDHSANCTYKGTKISLLPSPVFHFRDEIKQISLRLSSFRFNVENLTRGWEGRVRDTRTTHRSILSGRIAPKFG